MRYYCSLGFVQLFFYLSSYCNSFFSSHFFDYWFPYHIHLYTWSTQQVTVTKHMRCFFKTTYFPMFFPIYYFNIFPEGQMVSLFFSYMVSYTQLFDITSTYCFLIFLKLFTYSGTVCLAFVYFTTIVWDGVHAILGHVFCWRLDS